MLNSVFALAFTLLNMVVQFFSRKVFLDYLGTEILGLNTTAMNLLQFLNLAEMGIGAAVAFSLYKPLYDNDREAVSDIVTLFGLLYRRIAWIIIGCSMVLMCFFPWIFDKMSLPLWYAYASFGVLLFCALVGYFCNYKQVLLAANQMDYKLMYAYKSVVIIKVIVQMLAMYLFPHPYLWWLGLEVVFAVLGSATLAVETHRTFPWLKKSAKRFKELNKAYPELVRKMKQMYFHKIGHFVLTQSSPLVVYAFTTLTVVTLYGNYLMVIQGVTLILSAIFTSLTASVGNLVAENRPERILSVFYEILASQMWMAMSVSFAVYNLGSDFITLWLGKEYLLSNLILGILTLTFFLNTAKLNIGSFVSAYGLYGDIWAPLVEAVLNLGLSILLGYFYGLTGILTGIAISIFLVTFCWKTYYVFTRALHASLWQYAVRYLRSLVLGIVCWAMAVLPTSYLEARMDAPIVHLMQTVFFAVAYFAAMMLSDKYMRMFSSRIINLLLRR